MEFEEMQVIWNEQKNEKMYAVDEETLHNYIRGKGRSVNRLMGFFEWTMIAVNLIVAIVLLVDAFVEKESPLMYIFPALYLGYTILATIRRTARQQGTQQFDETVLGELDRAIWQLDYLIRQSRWVVVWYILPLVVVFGITMLIKDQPLWGLGLAVFLLPFTYFGGRWEVNRLYMPKRERLAALREKLIEAAE